MRSRLALRWGVTAGPRAGRRFRSFPIALFACSLLPAMLAWPAGGAEFCQPDGVCHPVQGTGVVISKGVVTPIGPLSPVLSGDRIVVQSGKVTVVDLRTGTQQVLAAGSDIVVLEPPTQKPDEWWTRLRRWFRESLSGSRLKHIAGGSVRGGEPSFWPDGARFAPGVPLTLEWYRVCPPSALRLVQGGRDTVVIALGDSTASTGGFPWPGSFPPRSGKVSWTLLDSDGKWLGGGRFEILTPTAADSARSSFLAAARDSLPALEGTLGAALLAAEHRQFLW
jgi:hypothetical protein